MARLAVIQAVEAVLAANWTATPVIKMNDSQSLPPKSGAEYVEVVYPVANETQMSIGAPGANVWREIGAFQVRLYSTRGAGLSAAITKADALAVLFRGQRIAANMECGEVDSAALHDDNDRGNYFVVGVIVNYFHDLIG